MSFGFESSVSASHDLFCAVLAAWRVCPTLIAISIAVGPIRRLCSSFVAPATSLSLGGMVTRVGPLTSNDGGGIPWEEK